MNEIVARENLARDYNIYVFHGTDGDDWDTEGKERLPELEKMLDLRQPDRRHHRRELVRHLGADPRWRST